MPTDEKESFVSYLLINYRWAFVCFFLLPASAIFELWLYVRNWLIFKLHTAPTAHREKVKHVQAQVREWNAKGRPGFMCTGRPGWQTMSFRHPKYKKTMTNIRINLMDILEIDTEQHVVHLEPLVTMGQLTATLNPLGWTVPVVPEIDDLTVGGLIMGAGIETSSHIYGLFQHTCLSYELVMPDGSVVTCSKEENSDLFYSVPWSHGTTGFLVGVQIRIIPCKPYVKVTYTPCRNQSTLAMECEKQIKNSSNEFVEGIIYTAENGVVMRAEFADLPTVNLKFQINKIGRFYKPWFYKHVENIMKRNVEHIEYIPLRHYYHRHTKSLFWELEDIIPFGNHPLFRSLAGWAVPPKVSFLKLTQPASVKKLYEQHHLIQDFLVPLANFREFLNKLEEEIQMYPLWICPFRLPREPGLVHAKEMSRLYVDFGAYGTPKTSTYQPIETGRRLEACVRSMNGFQMMYADTYMSREEFREMFDYSLYEEVRAKYECVDAFPEIYDKLNRTVRE